MTTPGPDTSTGAHAAPPGPDATQQELVADIEATRAELGETVDALSQKFDVKAQARDTLDDARQRATAQFQHVKDAATDEHGALTPQARTIAIRVGGSLAALLLVRAIWRKVRG